MRALPRRFKTLDGNWFRQVAKHDHLIHQLGEGGFDRIIADHRDVLAELLADAGLIDSSSKLKTLAVQHGHGQVLNIDVLFAEVDGKGEDDGDFRRLIIVEDKLEKNAEQRRKVLAQIMDYARELQDRSKASVLWNHLRRHFPQWTAENEEDIQICLDEGNFLLILAGDQFDPRLVELVHHYRNRLDPTDLAEICLVSFAIFQGPKDVELVIPNLIGAVTKGQRDITISVRVTSPTGEPLRAELNEVVETRQGGARIRKKKAWDEQLFFAELGKRGPETVRVARQIQTWAQAEQIPVEWRGGGAEGYMSLPFVALGKDIFLDIDSKGGIWVYPSSIRNSSSYGDEGARRRILDRLNTSGGLGISLDKANTWGKAPLLSLADDSKLKAFLAVAADVYRTVRSDQEA